jgi:PAS domain S-box-containing protein
MTDRLRVLYVDDEPGLLSIGKLFLEREGKFSVDTLISARQALEQIKTERYDAIISDYQMPEMDGIAFLKQLKASGNTTPFILFTGRGREEVVIQAINSGVDFYLQKGGEPGAQFAELAHKIKTAVSRQKTEKLAKDTERRLYDIINFLPDATFAIDTDGNVIAWNKAIEEMTGIPAQEMLGKGNYEYSIPFYGERRPILIDLVSIPEEELSLDKYAVIKKEGGILTAETTLPHPLGRYSILLGKASLLYNDEGTAIGAIESIRDITEQKQSAEDLRKAHDEYVDLLEHMNDVYYRSDTQGRLILASKSWAKDLGYDNLSECLGKNIADTFYADPGDRMRFLEEVYRKGSVSDYEVALKKKDGTQLLVATSSYLYFDKSGTVLGVEGTWRDITGRKQAEKVIRESEAYLKRAEEVGRSGSWEIRLNEKTVSASDGARTLYGFTKTQSTIEEIQKVPLPEYRPLLDAALMDLITGKSPYNVEFKTQRESDGTVLDIHSIAEYDPGRNAVFGVIHDITERKVAEEAHRKSEEQSRMLLSTIPDIVMVHQDGIIVYANQMAVEKTGYSEEELIGSHLFDHVKETDREIIILNMKKRAAGEPVGDYEIDMIHKSGALHHVIIRTSPIVFNQLPSVVFIIIDITERKRAEDALQHQSASFSILNAIITTANKADDLPQLLENILTESLRLLDFDAGGIYLVDRLTRTANVVHSKNLPKEFLAEIQTTPIDKKPYDTLFIKNEPIITENYEQIAPDRSKKFGFKSVAGIPLLSKGVAIGALNLASTSRHVISDEEKQTLISISMELGSTIERMSAEEEIKKAKENLETLFNSIDEMVFVLDMQGGILTVNDTVQKRLSYTSDELIGTNVLLLHVPERRDEALRIVQGMIAGTIDSCSVPVLAKDGTRIEVETKVTRGWWNGKEVLIGVTRDITDRKRVEEALAESEEKLSLFMRYCPNPVYIKDEDTRAVILSHHFEKMLRKPLSQLLGKTGEEIWPPELAAEMRADDEKVMKEGCTIERVETFEGRYFFSVKFPIPIPNHPTILGGYTIDITERKRVEEALNQANKKLTLLTSITRHDINNQLMVLQGYLAILEDMPLDPTHNEYLQKISTAAKRISAMVLFTKEYEQIGVNAPAWQDCRTLVNTAAMQAHLGKVTVENDLPFGAEVFADPLVIKVFYNLMDNAVRYGGKITIIRFSALKSGDDHLIVCEDDGDGVAAEEKGKIFDRGFGKNTGLGLALSREILDITGIMIKETGEPGKGARFEITVPKGMWR